MYKAFIANYIQKITLEDVESYIHNNYSDVSDEEIQVIYRYLKNRWREVYDEEEQVLLDLKKEVSPNTYVKIQELLKVAINYKNKL